MKTLQEKLAELPVERRQHIEYMARQAIAEYNFITQDRVIISNKIKCKHCGDVIYSANRHDYVACNCGKVAVDGGMDYLRRKGKPTDYEEQSIVIQSDLATSLMAQINWAKSTGRNGIGVLCAVMRGIRDAGYRVEKADA